MDAVVDGLIGFICDAGIAGADINFNLEVFGRVDDTFAVDVGGIDFGGGGEVDDAVFVSPANEDIMSLLVYGLIKRRIKKEVAKFLSSKINKNNIANQKKI